MKKKTYTQPKVEAVVLIGPTLMTEGSHNVTNYAKGRAITIGDEDDVTPTTAAPTYEE